MTSLAIIAACALPAFLLWAALHELAHVAAASLLVGLETYQLKLYPHRSSERGWVWAEATWTQRREANWWQLGAIALAPRVPDMLAAGAFAPCALAWGHGWGVALATFVGAGLVDLGVGSLGISPASDLRVAAGAWRASPWILRAQGWAVIAAAVVAFLRWLP